MKKKLFKVVIGIIIVCIAVILKIGSKIIINNRFISNYPNANQEYRLVLLSFLNLY